MHPRDRDDLLAAWRQCVATSSPYQTEARLCRWDGQYRRMLVRAAPILDSDGGGREWMGSGFDITDIPEAREREREHAEQLMLAGDAAKLGMWLGNVESDSGSWANDRLYDMFGIPKSESPINVSCFISEIIHPDDRAAWEDTLANTRTSGKALRHQGRFYRHSDRELRWLELTGLLLRDEEGRRSRMLVIAADITEQKRTKEELRIAHELLNMAMEGACEGVWEWDHDGQKAYYSQQFREIFGYKEAELADETMDWRSRIHPDDKPWSRPH